MVNDPDKLRELISGDGAFVDYNTDKWYNLFHAHINSLDDERLLEAARACIVVLAYRLAGNISSTSIEVGAEAMREVLKLMLKSMTKRI